MICSFIWLTIVLNCIPPSCKTKKHTRIEFSYDPAWLFIQANGTIYINQLLKFLILDKRCFVFLCTSLHYPGETSAHFRAVFYLNDDYYLIDDLNPNNLVKSIPKKNIITAFCYKKYIFEPIIFYLIF